MGAMDEHDIAKKSSAFLYEAILFRNGAKSNLPPGAGDVYFLEHPASSTMEEVMEEDAEKDLGLPNIVEAQQVSFQGCYLDQMTLLPLGECKAVSAIKERKTFRVDERAHKITESVVITIKNEMGPSDIWVQETFPR